MWESHEDWKDKMADTWEGTGASSSVQDLHEKLQHVFDDLQAWNKSTFGSVRKQIRDLVRSLENLCNDPSRPGPSYKEIKANERLVELYHREEIMGRQRSRAEWLSSGDKNTIFFHLRASMWWKKNMIKALKSALGVSVQDVRELKIMAREFYNSLYTTEGGA